MSATMESTNMMEENASTENGAKISDSGYSNTCSNSQSHTSSGSSLSRNSNRSVSSGYHGGNPSTLGSCTETLPKPITSTHKEKGYKKKKSKNASSTLQQQLQLQLQQQHQQPQHQQLQQKQTIVEHQQQHHGEPIVVAQASVAVAETPVAAAAAVAAFAATTAVTEIPCKPMIVDKTAEEVAAVELVDATDPGVHNDSNLASDFKAGLTAKINPLDESSSQPIDDYYAVISMNDGLVVHATPSLYATLGYAKDSWTGKLFTDFLDPKDNNIFTKRIASEIAFSKDIGTPGTNGQKASIFCRLRRYTVATACDKNELQQDQHHYHHHQHESRQPNDIQYMPFRVNVMIQNFHGDKLSAYKKRVLLLVATFQPIRSVYKVPEEPIIPTVFTTRHTATCRLSYVDPDVVQYLGYLPQDMIDRSLFDFYYPEDLPLIKDIYKTVINLESSSFRSKPYRYIVQNGDYVVLETEWSSFINPWTKSLEFVIGKHRVLKGPADPNIFRPVGNRKTSLLAGISEEVLKEAKIIEKEIRALLVEGVQRKSAYPIADNSNLLSKKSELASFVENILQEIKSPAIIKDHMAMDNRSFSEHDSVMLGEISPHHEYLHSRSSTETLPSYNQLNYNDNIERFFNSNIGTSANNRPYGSDMGNLHSSVNSSDDRGKNNASRPELKCTSSTNGSGNSGSQENLSSESNNQQSFGSGMTSNTTSNNSIGNDNNVTRTPLPILTVSLLNRHNEDMEKLMVQKHREQKKGDKRNKSSVIDQSKNDQPNCKGVAGNNKRLKRSASQSWDGDNKYNKLAKNEIAIMINNKQHNLNNIQSISNAKANMQNAVNSNPNMQHMGNSSHNIQTVTNSGLNFQNLVNSNPNVNLRPSMAMPPMPTIASQNQTFSSQNQGFTSSNTSSQALQRSYSQMQYSQMFPWFYMPVPQPWDNQAVTPQEYPRPLNPMSQVPPYCFAPVPYISSPISGMMYVPSIATPVPTTVPYHSYIVPESVPTAPLMNAMPQVVRPSMTQTAPPTAVPTTTASSFGLQRPASCETSVKAEPGSTMAMSESSKKFKIFSPSGVVSSCVSNDGGCFYGCSLNKSCNSCNSTSITNTNTDHRHTVSSFESSLNGGSGTGNGGTNANSYDGGSKKSSTSHTRVPRKESFWMEGVKLTPELMYQYQLEPRSISEVLKADLDFLKSNRQPSLVNDQLGQLFLDLDLEGFGSKLIIDEVNSSNNANYSNSDGSQRCKSNRTFT